MRSKGQDTRKADHKNLRENSVAYIGTHRKYNKDVFSSNSLHTSQILG